MEFRGIDLVRLADDRADRRRLAAPLGLQYLSANLKANGHPCRVVDLRLFGFSAQGLVRILDRHPDRAVGLYVNMSGKETALSWIRTLRESGLERPILVGGPGGLFAAEILQAGADLVVLGEGERTVPEVLDYLNGIRKESELRGVSYLKGGAVVEAPPQPLIDPIDGLAFPDRDEVLIETYFDFSHPGLRLPYAPMLTSRAGTNQDETGVRQRSAENCLAEIDLLTGRYDVRFIDFRDKFFGATRARLQAFCEGLILRRSPVRFCCRIHPADVAGRRDESAKLLARSGCVEVGFELPGVNPEVLEKLNRRRDEPAQLIESIHIFKRQSMAVTVAFHLPRLETFRQSVGEALVWSAKAKPHAVFFFVDSRVSRGLIPVLPEQESLDACEIGRRKFFFSRAALLRHFLFALRRNPGWLFHALKNRLHWIREAMNPPFFRR